MLCLGSGGGSTGIGTSSTPCVGHLNIAPASLLNFTDILAFKQPSDDIVNWLFRGVSSSSSAASAPALPGRTLYFTSFVPALRG